jgi:hypothetical protein
VFSATHLEPLDTVKNLYGATGDSGKIVEVLLAQGLRNAHVTNIDVRPYKGSVTQCQALFGTESEQWRDFAVAEVKRLQGPDGPFKSQLKIYKRQAVQLTRKIYTPASTHGIPQLLADVSHFHLLSLGGQVYHVNLVIWGDNCRAKTVVSFWLVDDQKKLFESGRSVVTQMLDFIGGEEDIKLYIVEVVNDILNVRMTQYHGDKGLVVKVLTVFLTGDHHFLNILTGVPGSSSHSRDPFASTLSVFWPLIFGADDCFFRIGDKLEMYTRITDAAEAAEATRF